MLPIDLVSVALKTGLDEPSQGAMGLLLLLVFPDRDPGVLFGVVEVKELAIKHNKNETHENHTFSISRLINSLKQQSTMLLIFSFGKFDEFFLTCFFLHGKIIVITLLWRNNTARNLPEIGIAWQCV